MRKILRWKEHYTEKGTEPSPNLTSSPRFHTLVEPATKTLVQVWISGQGDKANDKTNNQLVISGKANNKTRGTEMIYIATGCPLLARTCLLFMWRHCASSNVNFMWIIEMASTEADRLEEADFRKKKEKTLQIQKHPIYSLLFMLCRLNELFLGTTLMFGEEVTDNRTRPSCTKGRAQPTVPSLLLKVRMIVWYFRKHLASLFVPDFLATQSTWNALERSEK